MRILTVVPRNPISGNSADFNYLPPVGLAYICSVLKAAGHEVDCLNINHFNGTVEELLTAQLASGKPYDMVCAGGLSTAYRPIKRIVQAVRLSSPRSKVVLGGGLVSSEPELIFNAIKPDYVVVGEGEETITELTECLQHEKDPSAVAGLGYSPRGNGFVTTQARQPIMDLDRIPWPDYEALDIQTYLDHLTPTTLYSLEIFDSPRVYPIAMSRSCPYSCTFCFHPIGKKYRQRSLDSVMKELEVMVPRYKINIISIFDELFSSDSKRVMEFCDRLLELSKKTPWPIKWGCQLRVDRLDGTMLARMKEAGCFAVSYGFESYSPTVLKSMKKHITPAQIDRAVKLTLDNKISLQGNFIFGDRAETVETARETLKYWKANANSGIVLGFVSPFPGSALYEYCVEKGIIPDKLDYIENHILDSLNMSETMTNRDYLWLQAEVATSRYRYYILGVPSVVARQPDGRFTLKVTCPHCHEEVDYHNFGLPYSWYFRIMVYCHHCRRRFFMVSRLYRMVLKLAALLLRIAPMPVTMRFFALSRRLQSWAIRQVLKGKLDLSKLRKIMST